jgi:hypothetical protein
MTMRGVPSWSLTSQRKPPAPDAPATPATSEADSARL